ncbi:MAG: hypothetical protein QOI61_952 [Actinomycetota bacterium]
MIAEVPDATTVSEIVASFEEQGYVISFTAEADAVIRCGGCRTAGPASEVHVDGIARAEGPSDPGDQAMVVALRCAWCGASGVLVVGYGPQASAEDADVAALLPAQ